MLDTTLPVEDHRLTAMYLRLQMQALHIESLHALIIKGAVSTAPDGRYHAAALQIATAAHIQCKTDTRAAQQAFFRAAQYEEYASRGVTGLAHLLMMYNVAEWFSEGGSHLNAYDMTNRALELYPDMPTYLRLQFTAMRDGLGAALLARGMISLEPEMPKE